MCDCFLGYLNSDEVYKSNIKTNILELLSLQKQFEDYGIMKIPETVNGLVDGRKGYLSRFKFCPYCGKEHNWKEIIKEIKKPL